MQREPVDVPLPPPEEQRKRLGVAARGEDQQLVVRGIGKHSAVTDADTVYSAGTGRKFPEGD